MTLIRECLLECGNVLLSLRCPVTNPETLPRGPERDGLAALNRRRRFDDQLAEQRLGTADIRGLPSMRMACSTARTLVARAALVRGARPMTCLELVPCPEEVRMSEASDKSRPHRRAAMSARQTTVIVPPIPASGSN